MTFIFPSIFCLQMSYSKSSYDSEPNTFNGDSSDDNRDSDREALSFDSAEAVSIEERAKVIPSVASGDIRPTVGAVSLVVVPCSVDCANSNQYCDFFMRDTQAPKWHVSNHSEASTSRRVDVVAEVPSLSAVTIILQWNFKVSMSQPNEVLFDVDYFELNKVTKRKLAIYSVEYRIPDSIKWRIVGPTQFLSNPNDDQVVFFTDILKLGFQLPLQLAVQDILAHLGYAPGQSLTFGLR